MATKDMKVTGLIVHSANKFELRGTGIGNSLQKITVTKDTNGGVPASGLVTGTVSDVSANITEASQQVWNELNAKLAHFPFKVTTHHTGTKVSDLTFGSV
jgi:hypothetical protein